MPGSRIVRCLTVSLLALLACAPVSARIRHNLHVTLEPASHRFEVLDTITLPREHSSPVRFRLHAGLDPRVQGSGLHLRRLAGTKRTEEYVLESSAAIRRFTLVYAGEIFHPVIAAGGEYARGFSETPGVIGPRGVFLAGQSFWYPRMSDDLVTFSLAVKLPQGWHSVSQGVRTQSAVVGQSREEVWTIDHPQEEIYLIAGRFTQYRNRADGVETLAFLRQPDADLARRYLAATARYLGMYCRLIGPYPYRKFALVENFWETGYGMPSFTLLGPRVIRLPFILHSSYPHEILHNWWGNGVYVDYAKGNWAEGLTSYLADYLLKEQQGKGVEYRQETLQDYTDYVRKGRDFPLSRFRSRHSAASEAVGYGKAMMLFHMLRERLGDALFVKALREVYRQYLFKVTSFEDLAATFSRVSGQPLRSFFEQWVQRTGAPFLRVQDVRATQAGGGGWRLTAVVEQIQPGPAYRLELPLAVSLQGAHKAYQRRVAMDQKTLRLTLSLPSRPVRLAVDPRFDLFRRLHRDETPAALSQVFGAERVLIVLPARAPRPLREGYAGLARAWSQESGTQLTVTTDAALDELPADRAVWLLGWENRFRPVLERSLSHAAFGVTADHVQIAGSVLGRDRNSVVIVARRRRHPDHALAWLASENAAALPGLARKLPHYGKYSYLGFTGSAPRNVLEGRWPVTNSSMSIPLAGARDSAQAVLAPRKPLIELPPPPRNPLQEESEQ